MDQSENLGFWARLPRPFFCLAPMEDVTDLVFRDLVADLGSPDVFFTEFVKAEGIAQGKLDSLNRLLKGTKDRPLVAQIWGTNPSYFYHASKILIDMGFDGIDINMGCPQASITSKGACSALIKNPQLAQELVLACKEAVNHTCQDRPLTQAVPVSVKTRVSFRHPPIIAQVDSWLDTLLATKPAVLTIHGRSAEQQSEGEADWSHIKRIRSHRDSLSPSTLLVGNGDVMSILEASGRVSETSCDGIMIGRGIFSDPSLFSARRKASTEEASTAFLRGDRGYRIALALQHLERYESVWGTQRNYHILKKFFKIYLQGFTDADTLRGIIMETQNYSEARSILVNASSQGLS